MDVERTGTIAIAALCSRFGIPPGAGSGGAAGRARLSASLSSPDLRARSARCRTKLAHRWETFRAAFARADLDRDGFLSRSELQVGARLGAPPAPLSNLRTAACARHLGQGGLRSGRRRGAGQVR